MQKSFWQAGHKPTLFSAFLYFDLSFMVWVLLGPLAVQMAVDLQLTAAEKGMMVATPVLAGALLRIVMGVLVDHIKPKMAGLVGQVIVIIALTVAWLHGIHNFQQSLMLGIFLGFAGASFAVALPLASRWYPPEHQGTALGIAGAGNSGTVFAALFAPGLAVLFGWNNVFGLALIPLLIVFVIYAIYAKDSPDTPPAKSLSQYVTILRDKDAWWFMFFYSVTFGGFVGLASSLTIYFNDLYNLGPVVAGYCTAAAVFSGSLARPIGGMIADRIGGIRTLLTMYAIAALLLLAMSFGQPNLTSSLSIVIPVMAVLGMGNGAVFQLVPQRFRKEIGVMTGLVGMAGGIGGFYLAASLGWFKQITGSYQLGVLIFAGLAVLAIIGLASVKTRWRTTWGSSTATSAKV
ncbi:MAG: MFS transporter [Betaproteobacteria bacterium HGW-Betaproteobacteria-1]|nr:MAG: MFS transporter [Betaproteobacteria bacterium HGW-Betaproteobacteria-1]